MTLDTDTLIQTMVERIADEVEQSNMFNDTTAETIIRSINGHLVGAPRPRNRAERRKQLAELRRRYR